jgi:hypothetical protein
MEVTSVGDWTFRVYGEPFALDADEQRDIASEIVRLRALIGGTPETRRVHVDQNPAGLVGEYTSLLIESAVRGHAAADVLPTSVRRRYSTCHWFTVSLEVLAAFSQARVSVNGERANLATDQQHARS